MLCSKCREAALVKVDGIFICSDRQCGHMELTPLSFEPEFCSSKDDDKPKSAYHSQMGQGEVRQKEIGLRKVVKEIKDACHLLKYSECIANLAISIAFSAHTFQQEQEQPRAGSLKEAEKVRQNYSQARKIASFSLLAACYQRQFLLEEFRITRYFKFSLKAWRQVVSKFNSLLRDRLNDLPPIRSAGYLIKKMCKSRNISLDDEIKMLKITDDIKTGKQSQVSTIACLAFWKIYQSNKRENPLKLQDICRHHDDLYESGKPEKQIEMYFDIAPSTIRKLSQRKHLV